mmetsp:Transcript_15448/g.58748  ORF Transcript_15448/g.58748 Transcript_15448/m.58748 type:complete len:221 (-) Transcript_15448:42-704(-)
MHHEVLDAGPLVDGGDEVPKLVVAVHLVDADAAFDARRQARHALLHGLHDVGNEVLLSHQGGTKATLASHALGRAAAIEVHLVVSKIACDASCPSHDIWIRPAQLQHQRLLLRTVRKEAVEQSVVRGVNDLLGRDHLRPKHGLLAKQAEEEAEVAIGVVHHGRNAEQRSLHPREGSGPDASHQQCSDQHSEKGFFHRHKQPPRRLVSLTRRRRAYDVACE